MSDESMEDRILADDAGFLVRLNHVRDRWRDHSLTWLLAVQLITIFGLAPATAEGLRFPPEAAALLLLLFMSLTILMARGRWTLSVGLGTLVLAGASEVLRSLLNGVAAEVAGNLVALLTFVVLSVVVFSAVFRPGRFTNHRIRGAIVLYLNLGLLFAFVHRIVAELLPGAYAHLPAAGGRAAFRAATDYFSFTTLTSVGYGDIVPVRPIARSLCTLEATLGQLLPTVLIARVVILAMREEE